MTEHERTPRAPGYEDRAAVFVERYHGTLDAMVQKHLREADRIVDGHGDELEEMLEQGGWTENDLITTLNVTSSSVGKLLSHTYSAVDDFLERSHGIALENIPAEDERQWYAIGRQIGRTGLDSEEVEDLFRGASSRQSAAIMRIACDYPLWLFVQQKAGENGMRGLQRFIDAATDSAVSNGINVGMDYILWRAIQANAIKHGPDNLFVGGPQDASDERISQAMAAGLDYQAAMAVYERRSVYDRGRRPSHDMGAALDSATPLAREAIGLTLGGRYDEELRQERESREYYEQMGDEARESFGGRQYSFEEYIRRMINMLEGRRPEDDGYGWEEEPADFAPDPDIPDPYKVLGVSRDASQRDIKKAYRKLAREHHPDLNGGKEPDEETIKLINNAYDMLGNPDRRAYYDQFGTTRGS